MNENKLGYYKGLHVLNNIYSFLETHASKFPQRPILKWVDRDTLAKWPRKLNITLEHQSITVAQLYFLSNRLAKGFSDLGIKKGDRVILFVPMSVPLYSSMFALQKIGAIPTFLDSWARRDQLGASAKVAMPKAMISIEQAFNLCEGDQSFEQLPLKIVVGPHKKKYNTSFEKLKETKGDVDICPVEQESSALITFTTGSSGTPKGANRTHRFLAAQHYALHRTLPYEKQDVDLPVFPIFSLNNLAEGVATVIPAIDVGIPSLDDPLILFAQMKACHVTCATLSPSLLNKMSDFCIKNKLSMPNLRRGVTGGAPISRDNLIDFRSIAKNAQVWVLYGSTEVEPIAHIEAKEMIDTHSISQTDNELVDLGVNVGKIDSGLQFKFIKIDKGIIKINNDTDWDKFELSRGEVGELIVAGEHVCQDYFNNKEAFFRAKILDSKNIVWHRTGDLGRIDENNNLWLVGRVHNVIHRNGEYCYPVRAEIVMKKLAFVKDCAYLGVNDNQLKEKAICVFSINDNAKLSNLSHLSHLSKEEMKNEVQRILQKNDVIFDQIIIHDDIPMDARHHSKVEYTILRNDLINKGYFCHE